MKKKIVAFIISFIFIVYLYSFVRLQEIVSVFHNSSLLILFSGIILFVPTIILSSYRFMILASPTIKLKFSKCFELTMQASFMNLFLPSKMGDIIKSVFIQIKFVITCYFRKILRFNFIVSSFYNFTFNR